VITDENSGCSDPISTSVSVLVVEDATVDVSVDNAEVCIGGSAILSAAVSGGSSVFTYQWQDSISGGSWTVIGGATNMTYSAPTAVSGLTWYRVVITDTNSDCSDPASTAVLVAVVEDATVDVSVDNAEVCIDGDATLSAAVSGGSSVFTYQWENSIDNSTWLPIIGATDMIYSAPTAVSGLTWYRVVITDANSGCSDPVSTSVSVLVEEDALVNVSVDNAETCIGGSVTVTANVTGGSSALVYQWQASGNNIDWTNISGATNINYVASTTSAGITYYRVELTDTITDCSDPVSESITVTVFEDITLDVQISDTEVCLDGNVLLEAIVTGGTSSLTYQWQSSIDNTLWDDITGANGPTYIPPTDAVGLIYYRMVLADSNSGCDAPISSSLSLTVHDYATVDVDVDNSEVCIGGIATITATVSGGSSSLTYQWQASTDNISWADIIGATSDTYNPLTTSADTTFYRVKILDSTTGCTDATSASLSVIVFEDAVVNVNVDNPDVCVGGNAQLSVSIDGGSASLTIQWQASTDEIVWADLIGETGLTYTAPTSSVGLTYYRVVITDSSAGCSQPVSASSSVNVVPDPTVLVNSDATEICEQGAALLTATVDGGVGAPSYQWQFEVAPDFWVDIPTANQQMYNTLSLSPAGIYNYRVVISQVSGCDVISDPIAIDVLEIPTVTITSDVTEVCEDGVGLLESTVTGGTGNTNYQWQSNVPGFGWIDIPLANQSDYTTLPLTVGSYDYRVVVTQNSGCGDTSNIVTLTAVEDPVATITTADTTICEDGTAFLTALVDGGSGSISYQWQSDIPGFGWIDIPSANQSTYTTTSLGVGSYSYRVIVSQNSGCIDTSGITTVTVVADPTVSVTVAPAEICEDGTATLTALVSDGAGSSTYQWQAEVATDVWVDIPGANQINYTTLPLPVGTFNYQVVVTQNSGCGVTSGSTTVTVYADPIVTATSDVNEICADGTALLTASISGGTGSASYQWQFEAAENFWVDIPSANQMTYTTTSLSVGSYDYRVLVTQNSGCGDTSNITTITVLPDPTVSVEADVLEVCDGGSATITATVNGGTGLASYQWQAEVSEDVWVDIPGANQLIFNTSSLEVGTHTYRIIITQNSGCGVTSAETSINVIADPVVTITGNSTQICDQGVVDFTSDLTGGTGTTIYQWQREIIANVWADIPGANFSIYTTEPLTVGMYNYRLIVSQNSGCGDTSNVYSVNVVADPVVSVSIVPEDICENGTADLTATVSGGSGSITYQWQSEVSPDVWVDIPGANGSIFQGLIYPNLLLSR
jgi:putative AlgH/UPF0301 family transcriptional regulator